MTQKDIAVRIKLYAGFSIIVTTHLLQDAIWVKRTYPQARVIYLNEPNETNQDTTNPAAAIREYSYLKSIGVQVWGASVTSVAPSSDWTAAREWDASFRALGGYKLVYGTVKHLYGTPIADLPAAVRAARVDAPSGRLMIGEYGPTPFLPDKERGEFYAAAIKAQRSYFPDVPIVMYRFCNPDGSGLVDSVGGAWTKPNDAYAAVRAGLSTL